MFLFFWGVQDGCSCVGMRRERKNYIECMYAGVQAMNKSYHLTKKHHFIPFCIAYDHYSEDIFVL